MNLKNLFLVDGFGALISAISLGVVLVHFQPLIGIPESTLYFLAFWPIVFAIYDFYCYLKINENLGFYLRCIAYANLLYCVLSLGLAFFHFQQITFLGWLYIVIEVLIVLYIVNLELKTAAKK